MLQVWFGLVPLPLIYCFERLETHLTLVQSNEPIYIQPADLLSIVASFEPSKSRLQREDAHRHSYLQTRGFVANNIRQALDSTKLQEVWLYCTILGMTQLGLAVTRLWGN